MKIETEENPTTSNGIVKDQGGGHGAILATGFEATESQELWVAVDNRAANDNNKEGILLSDIKRRDGCVDRLFPNGCSTKKVSSLLELRDALNSMLPSTEPTISCPSTPSSTLPESLDEVNRLELFRSVIEHEDELLNQRVSWIILAQSFLMAAFITSDAPDSMRYVTASVGLATVIVTLPAIVAAGRNIELQQHIYFQGLKSDARCQQLHGHYRDLSIKDKEEMSNRVAKGHIFPNMAFRSTYSIPILYTVVALAFVQFAGWIFLLMTLMVNDF